MWLLLSACANATPVPDYTELRRDLRDFALAHEGPLTVAPSRELRPGLEALRTNSPGLRRRVVDEVWGLSVAVQPRIRPGFSNRG